MIRVDVWLQIRRWWRRQGDLSFRLDAVEVKTVEVSAPNAPPAFAFFTFVLALTTLHGQYHNLIYFSAINQSDPLSLQPAFTSNNNNNNSCVSNFLFNRLLRMAGSMEVMKQLVCGEVVDNQDHCQCKKLGYNLML